MAECFLHSLMQLIWASFLLSVCHASWQAALQIHPIVTPGWRLQGLAAYAISVMICGSDLHCGKIPMMLKTKAPYLGLLLTCNMWLIDPA